MLINCFRGARDDGITLDEAPRQVKRSLRRTVTNRSNTSSSKGRGSVASNSSIATLPPCKRSSDAKIEAMMMPVPPEPRPSRCLRLSQPRTYSSLVDSMKACRGCRDWRSFDVFYEDEVDMTKSADWEARKRAAETEKKIRRFGSVSSSGDSAHIPDMIG